MKRLFFVTFASTALATLSDQASVSHDSPQTESQLQPQPPAAPAPEAAKTPSYAGTATSLNCLNAFNEARTAAGLASFVSAGDEFKVKDLESTNQQFISNVCKALMTETPLEQTDSNFNRTIALAIQDGEEGDCAAAVTHFNGALSLFGDLPPAFSTGKESVYRNLQAVSFVALYNPGDDPKLDCGYFTCKKSEAATTTPSPSPNGVQTKTAQGESQTVTATLHGLLCATSPPALTAGKAPFEQDQFDKIKAAINSASAAVPVFLTLALLETSFILF